MRRVWIEILGTVYIISHYESPSMRRVWIEINQHSQKTNYRFRSPSMRRVWIEIAVRGYQYRAGLTVTLHAEGVD